MPIRVTCRCGQSLSVADAMAGKSGKCPKCSEILRIPSSSGGSETASSAAKGTSKPKSASTTSPIPKPAAVAKKSSAPSDNALDKLFSEAGLDKPKGPQCPSCKAPIDPNAALCTSCGFHLATGQKMKGAEIETASLDPEAFANRQLNEAKKSLKKEYDADEAAKFTGAPWWVALALVLGMITVIAFGVILVEGFSKDDEGEAIQAVETSFKGKLQRLPLPNALAVIGTLVSAMVVTMAWIATSAAAFRDQAAQGLMCIAIPFYAHYYCFKERLTMKSTMSILWGWSVVLIVLGTIVLTTGSLAHLLKK